MSTVRIRKRSILQEDIAFDDNGTGATENFVASDGSSKSGHKINAGMIPILTALSALLGASNVNSALTALYKKINAAGGAATETSAGIAEIATRTEVQAGTDNTRIVTPYGLAGLTATSALAGLVKLATEDDLTDGTNTSSVVTVGIIGHLLWPAGSVRLWMLEAVPTGWLECKGQLISRENFSDLWDAVKSEAIDDSVWTDGQFGKFSKGDGATTFRLPDARGMFPRFADHGRGKDPDASSRTGGDTVGSVQADCVGAHTHDVQANAGSDSGGGAITNGGSSESQTIADAALENDGNETRPVNIALSLIIKY